jgi:GAF domain-containing protein
MAELLRTGRPARSDDYSRASGASGDAIRRMGARSGVAAPIIVEGHLWGMIAIVGRRRFPADTEQRMAGFTELVGTAIANAEGRAQLEESRDEIHRLADEQAALRRVAMLVARGYPRTTCSRPSRRKSDTSSGPTPQTSSASIPTAR